MSFINKGDQYFVVCDIFDCDRNRQVPPVGTYDDSYTWATDNEWLFFKMGGVATHQCDVCLKITEANANNPAWTAKYKSAHTLKAKRRAGI